MQKVGESTRVFTCEYKVKPELYCTFTDDHWLTFALIGTYAMKKVHAMKKVNAK